MVPGSSFLLADGKTEISETIGEVETVPVQRPRRFRYLKRRHSGGIRCRSFCNVTFQHKIPFGVFRNLDWNMRSSLRLFRFAQCSSLRTPYEREGISLRIFQISFRLPARLRDRLLTPHRSSSHLRRNT